MEGGGGGERERVARIPFFFFFSSFFSFFLFYLFQGIRAIDYARFLFAQLDI